MGKNKLQWGRPEIAINEAIEILGCKVGDLFHMASKDELTIYFLADHCKTREIYSIDKSKNWSSPSFVSGPEAPPYGSSDDPDEWDRQMQAHEIGLERQDVSIGQLTTYGRLTDFKYLYEKQWKGCQPIAAETFSEFCDRTSPAAIQLDLDRICKWETTSIKHFVRLEPDSHIKEALYEGKLFVLKAEVLPLVSDENVAPSSIAENSISEPASTEPFVDAAPIRDNAHQSATTSPRVGENTQARYDLWQSAAKTLKESNQSLSKSDIARILSGENSPIAKQYRKDFHTIRKHIKI